MKKIVLPSLPPEMPDILAALEAIFPDRAPETGTPLDKVWFNAGAAKVVRYLRSEWDKQNRNILES